MLPGLPVNPEIRLCRLPGQPNTPPGHTDYRISIFEPRNPGCCVGTLVDRWAIPDSLLGDLPALRDWAQHTWGPAQANVFLEGELISNG
jgi:hypothetical protein